MKTCQIGTTAGRSSWFWLCYMVVPGFSLLSEVIAYLLIAGGDPHGPVVAFGATCMVIFGVVLYSAPSIITGASVT